MLKFKSILAVAALIIGWGRGAYGVPETIRVAIAHFVPKVEAAKAVTNPKEGTTAFRGHKYKGEFKFYDNPDGTMTAVNVLPLEEYLVGLVASEMPTDWPIEAIKAQGVVARTYAIFQKKAREGAIYVYDLEATTTDQVYKGALKNDARVREAVLQIEGEVLKSHGRLLKAFFHSTCGGQTETALNVWGEKNLFPPVTDPYCSASHHSSWTYTITKNELVKKLRAGGFPAETIEGIQIERHKGNPRTATVIIDTGNQTVFIQGNDLRKMVGFEVLKSTWFDTQISGQDVIFKGRGFGHGVGMCQWGAKGMAEAGKNYREILRFYYPGTKIVK